MEPDQNKTDYSFYFGMGIILVVGLIMASLFIVPKVLSNNINKKANDNSIDEEYIKQATSQLQYQWWTEEYTTKSPEELPKDVQSRLKVLTLDIEGMVCTGCARAIKDSLERGDGVITAKTDYQQSTGTVVYDLETTNPEKIISSDIFRGYYKATVESNVEWSG